MASTEEEIISPYNLEFLNGLPPGTDSYEQLRISPRHPRPPPTTKRPVPPLPKPEERKGKWVDRYLDQLDPETEYDQIVRTAIFFKASEFGISLSYAAVFCMLIQTPSGATAIHGGKLITRGHQRFYDTLLMNLHWMYHGSSDPETIKYISKINKLHSGVWKRYPGVVSAPWEAQMSVIGNVYFETWVRKTINARKQYPHPAVRGALPAWGERLTSHFVTEPTDGTRSMGINFVRNWDELERFFYWFDDFPFEQQSTPEQKRRAQETAKAMVHQFCDLWFPQPLHFIGRQILLVFIPPGCRRTHEMGEPNRLFAIIVKIVLKLGIDFSDAFGSDPVEPPMEVLREKLMNMDLNRLDKGIQRKGDDQHRIFLVLGVLIAILVAVYS